VVHAVAAVRRRVLHDRNVHLGHGCGAAREEVAAARG
jgi:hypothetical protein